MIRNINSKSLKLRASAVLAATMLAAPLSSAQIVADFVDGNTNQEVDGFIGKAGYGWTSAWNQAIHDSKVSTLNATVSSSNPLAAGHNYLSVTHNAIYAEGTGRAMLAQRRGYSDHGEVAMDQRLQVSFQFRADDVSAFENTGTHAGRFYFFDASVGRNAPGSNITWGIVYRDSEEAWGFYNGTNIIDSTLGLTEGTVYDFKVYADPTSKTYDVVISDGITSIRASDFNDGDALKFYTDRDTFGGQLHFGSEFSVLEEKQGSIEYSIGSISIIPEPGSVAALIGLLGLGLVLLVRRKEK